MEENRSISPEDAHKAILEDGFCSFQDPALGQRIAGMEARGTPFASADGLMFCNDNVLKNENLRPILESFFDWFGLGLYRSIGATPGDNTFKQSDPESQVESLIVQLWSGGSQVTYWKGSHHHRLPSVRGENFWRVPRASLRRLGLEPVQVTFDCGGFAIVDPRVATEFTRGTCITFAFGTKEVVKTAWSPMRIPRTKDVEETVALMENSNSNFGMNVAYIG